MRKIFQCFFLSTFVLLVTSIRSYGSEGEAGTRKNILVIFSYAPNTPAHSIILEGVRQKLFERYGDNINLYIEYLEVERYPAGQYPKENFELLNHKYESIKMDILITVGYGAPAVIRKYAARHILDLPAITIDYDFSRYGITPDMLVNNRTTTIPLKWDFGKLLSISLEIFPETSNIFFAGGSTKTDSLFLKMAKIVSEQYASSKKITFLTGMSMDQLLSTVRQLPGKSIIIISSFNEDSRHVKYLYSEASRLITRSANAPVFVYADTAFGDGQMGGYLISFNKVGILAGEIAIKIMNGTDPTSIITSEKDIYELVFDWRALEKWKVRNSTRLPEGSIVKYRKLTFFENYKWYILSILFFIIFQTVLIFNLIILNRKQKIMHRIILESEEKYRKLIREDRIHEFGQLTSSLSHELNQPLTSILSNAQAGVRFIDAKKYDEALIKDILLNIVDDNKRASSILSSVRNIMKLENREKEKTDLKKVVLEIVELCRSKVTESNTKLELELPSEPVFVIIDDIQIQQVLLNLILNASQAMKKGERGNAIHIAVRKDEENVYISVVDNGTGIEPSIIDNLFKTFVTTKKEGSGIGLAIAKSIIEDHKGKIWAENMPDNGAKFTFTLKHCHA